MSTSGERGIQTNPRAEAHEATHTGGNASPTIARSLVVRYGALLPGKR